MVRLARLPDPAPRTAPASRPGWWVGGSAPSGDGARPPAPAGMPGSSQPPLPAAPSRTVMGWGSDTVATIDPGQAHNPPNALACGTLTHRRLWGLLGIRVI